ncbi:MAG: hypothetical protein JSR53_04925 [Proteobacteria bacterium]|nr:hypothetical protein [Pseudomonadota bacterium]
MRYSNGTRLPYSLSILAALAMAACGGGGGGTSDPGTGSGSGGSGGSDASVTLSGVVAAVGTLKNVVVCLDLNGNDACDGDEPASAATGADGKYSLATTSSKAAAARLIAPVKTGDPAAATTAIDSQLPAEAATPANYVLKRPAGSGGAINPLTTLVQAGVAAGMKESDARANVALQLAIDAAKIDNYQDDPAWDAAQVRDTTRTAAALVSAMLRQGVALEVGDQQAAAPASTTLRQLNYSAPGGYYVRTVDQQAKAAGSAEVPSVDARSGKSGGVDMTEEALYGSAYLTPSGWKYCNRSALLRSSLGNPKRTVYCEGQTTLGWNRVNSVAGEAMATLVNRWQAMPSNTINAGISTTALTGKLGTAAFAAGAEEWIRTNVELAPSITITNLGSRGLPQSRNTLEAVIAYYPTSGAASPTGANTLSLALTSSALKALRASFAPTSATQGTATYYECDLNEAQTVVSNCAAIAAKGSYSIDTINGARVLRFAGQPATPALNYQVAYAEIQWTAGDPSSRWVYRAHEIKPDISSRLSTTNRLNDTAWAALKAQLGL